MSQNFQPPIEERKTRDLLVIIGQEEHWQPLAVELAKAELKRRGYPDESFHHAKYLEAKRLRLEALRKAKTGFTFCDFLCNPLITILQLTFLWEFEKDGFHRKASQQRKFRVILLFMVILLVMYVRMYGC